MLSNLHKLANLTLIVVPYCRNSYYHPYLIHEKEETQWSRQFAQGHIANKWQREYTETQVFWVENPCSFLSPFSAIQ